MRINRMQILILVISLSNLPARCAQLILSNMAELAEVTVTTLLYRIRVIVRECLASLPRVSAENLPTIIAATRIQPPPPPTSPYPLPDLGFPCPHSLLLPGPETDP